MRIDSFFFSFIFLVLSLLVLLFSENLLLNDIAYIATLLSIALFTIDDWLDIVFMKLARFLFTISGTRFTNNRTLRPAKNIRHLFFMRRTRALKSRQRWPHEHNNRIRYITHK